MARYAPGMRLAAAFVVLAVAGSCSRPEAVRHRRRDQDAVCTDRAKPLAYTYAVPDEAFRARCYDVRVKGAVDPRHPDDQVLDEMVFCCPR